MNCNDQSNKIDSLGQRRLWHLALALCCIVIIESIPVASANTSGSGGTTATDTQSTGTLVDEYGNVIVQERVYTEKELAAMQAIYPQNIVFTQENIKNGGSILFLIGIAYCFFGIQLATQNYINPAIDIIKKKGMLGAELMNVSLLAMSNSLAESFIIVNSIFFGVSDIGISTVVQQSAFYGLINQGMFYLIVQEGTLIDWWIVSRETAFFLLYLAVMSVLLNGNQVDMSGAIVLFCMYILHILLMKYSSKYEVVIKKLLAQTLELRELNRMANNEEVYRFHQSLKSEALCIEQLNRMEFSVINGYIVFANTNIQYKLQPIVCVKLGEEQFAEKDDRQLMARLNFKRAVTKIIVKIQAYKFNLHILRTQACKQSIKKLLPNMPEHHVEEDIFFGEEYYDEDNDDSDQDELVNPYEEAQRLGRLTEKHKRNRMNEYMQKGRGPPYNKADQFHSKPGRKNYDSPFGSSPSNAESGNRDKANSESSKKISDSGKDIEESEGMFSEHQDSVEQEADKDQEWEEYRDHPQPVQIPQSFVYELILKNVYKEQKSFIAYPTQLKDKIRHVILFPHIIMQYVTIPNPMAEGKEQFYPLTLVCATIWVWAYSFFIVWWTYVVTISYDLHFSILPMIIYPFGIVLRDLKKLDDMRVCVSVFKRHCADQRMGLAETFSGPVFQITGLMGLAWTLYITTTNKPISFINEGIQYQFPLLFGTMIVKYLCLVCFGYKTSRKLFYTNLAVYALYLLFIILIDYRLNIFGGS